MALLNQTRKCRSRQCLALSASINIRKVSDLIMKQEPYCSNDPLLYKPKQGIYLNETLGEKERKQQHQTDLLMAHLRVA